uniref:Tetratricopeptide repeat protein n=1 Tax=viral metagenome TaxID=1070528 RepID=A0A6C0AEY1_9ZZZZ
MYKNLNYLFILETNKMFENTEDLNVKYALGYHPRHLTFFEKKILNENKKLNLKDYDLTNIEVLDSLSIYYHLQYIKTPSQENENLYLCILIKLSKIDPCKGNIRISSFYDSKNNYDKAIEYCKKAIENNSGPGYYNLYILETKYNPNFDGNLEHLMNALKLRYYPVIFEIAKYYIFKNEINTAFKFLEYGIYKESKECLQYVNMALENSTYVYSYLLKIPFTNKLIEEEKSKLFPRVIQENINKDIFFKIFGSVSFIAGSSNELIKLYG